MLNTFMNGKHMTRSRGATRLQKEYHINTIVSLFPRPSTSRLLNLKPEREDTKILLYLREFFFFFSFFSRERPKNHRCCNHYIDLMQLLKSKYKQVNNLVKINFNVTTGEIELCKRLLQTSTKKFGHIKSILHLELQG